MRRRLRWMALAAAALVLLSAPTARADTTADTLDVAIEVNADGSLQVTERLEFSAAPGEVTRVLPLTRDVDDSSYHRLTVTDAVTTLDGVPVDAISGTDDAMVVTVDVTGAGVLESSYRVVGATSEQQGQDGDLAVATWPALHGLSVGVKRVEVRVSGPGPQLMDCVAGPTDSVGKCGAITGGTFDSPDPVFQDGPRDAADEVVVTVGYDVADVTPDAVLQHRWSLDRAFEVSPPTLGWAALAAALGGLLLYLLHRRAGQDLDGGAAPTLVAGFRPTGDGESVFEVRDAIRPGLVGTVADERVDPLDVTATLLDLAVRGHLRFTELPREHHGLMDWRLERRESADPLARYERELLDVVAPDGARLLVSELPAALAAGVGRVQDALYDEVVARGWFESRPDSTRSSWRVRGYGALVLALVAAVLLVMFSNLGLVALVLLGLGAGLVWVADRMPRRTAVGSALLDGLQALSAVLAVQPTDELPQGRELSEASKVLGYTVVLGSGDRWLDALVAGDPDPDAPDPDALDWYHAPATWHLRDLPSSLAQLITTLQGRLTLR